MLFELIDLLPDEIIVIIFKFLPIRQIIFLNKHYYINYASHISTYIYNYMQYIIDMVRNDSIFVIKTIINNNFDFINKKIKIKFKNYKFTSYFELIYFLSKKYQSNKCISYINFYFSDNTKEWLKNNPHKDNRWIS